MPEEVQDTFGYALYLAQVGRKHEQAKPLKGFGSAGTLEVVEQAEGGSFRAVYTVTIGRGDLCAAWLPEEIHTGNRHPQARHRRDP